MPTVTEYAANASGTDWVNPTNANADDGSVATYTIAAKNTTGNVNVLSNFGFDSSIPVGATINSVTLEVEHRVTTASGIAHLEAWVRVGTTNSTINTDSSEPTTLTAVSYADQPRPGGGSWTRDDLLDGTFTVRLQARSGNSSASVTYEWDYARVVVDYTVTYSGSAALTLGGVEVAGAGTFTPPAQTFTGDAALTLGGIEVAGAAEFTAPVFSGSAALVLGGVEVAAAATFTPIGTGHYFITKYLQYLLFGNQLLARLRLQLMLQRGEEVAPPPPAGNRRRRLLICGR